MSENIKDHIITYRNVFIALLFFTGVTVGVSYIEFSSITFGLFIGLLIACIKGFLVASQFMHLNDEKSFIYGTLLLTVVFFFVLLMIPISWHANSSDVTTKRNNPFDEYKTVNKTEENNHHKEGH